MSTLREVWMRVFPERTRMATKLAREAFEAKKARDVVVAMTSAEQALELDPFDEVLRNTLVVWESLAKGPQSMG